MPTVVGKPSPSLGNWTLETVLVFGLEIQNRSHVRDLGAQSTPKCSIVRRASFLKSYQLSFEVHIWTLRSNNMRWDRQIWTLRYNIRLWEGQKWTLRSKYGLGSLKNQFRGPKIDFSGLF